MTQQIPDKFLYQDDEYDNVDFSVRYLKDNSYNVRLKKVFGAV